MVRKYKESMAQKLMESFDTNSAHLVRFSVFNPVTLVVQTGFGDDNELLEGVKRDLGINQRWLVDQENKDGTTVDVVGHCKALAHEKIRPWARGLCLMRLKTIGRGRGGHPWWAHPYSS